VELKFADVVLEFSLHAVRFGVCVVLCWFDAPSVAYVFEDVWILGCVVYEGIDV
jgi:hypothetical protein